MVLMLFVDDVIWVTSNNPRLFGPDGPGTVTKRGRIYATVKWNGRDHKYTLAAHKFKQNAYGEEITAYVNRDAYLNARAIEKAWQTFHNDVRGAYHHTPPSLEAVAHARTLLGLRPDPNIINTPVAISQKAYPTTDE